MSLIGEVPEFFNLRNLERQRTKRGWTREYLSEISGVPARTIKDQERSDTEASLETAWRLSKALGCDLDVLLLESAGGEVMMNTIRRRRVAHRMLDLEREAELRSESERPIIRRVTRRVL